MATSTYTRYHSDAAVAAGIPNAQPSVTIGAGKKRLVRVKFVSQGRLTDVDIVQSGGTAVAAVVDVLKSQAAFPPDVDVPVGDSPTLPLLSLDICPTIDVASGGHGTLQQDNQGYAFRNIDGTSTNNQRFVYVLINPTSAGGPTTWDIQLTTESTVGD